MFYFTTHTVQIKCSMPRIFHINVLERGWNAKTISILFPKIKTIFSCIANIASPLQPNVWKMTELFPLPSMVFILIAHRMKSPKSTFPSLLLYLMTRALNVLLLKRKPKTNEIKRWQNKFCKVPKPSNLPIIHWGLN